MALVVVVMRFSQRHTFNGCESCKEDVFTKKSYCRQWMWILQGGTMFKYFHQK